MRATLIVLLAGTAAAQCPAGSVSVCTASASQGCAYDVASVCSISEPSTRQCHTTGGTQFCFELPGKCLHHNSTCYAPASAANCSATTCVSAAVAAPFNASFSNFIQNLTSLFLLSSRSRTDSPTTQWWNAPALNPHLPTANTSITGINYTYTTATSTTSTTGSGTTTAGATSTTDTSAGGYRYKMPNTTTIGTIAMSGHHGVNGSVGFNGTVLHRGVGNGTVMLGHYYQNAHNRTVMMNMPHITNYSATTTHTALNAVFNATAVAHTFNATHHTPHTAESAARVRAAVVNATARVQTAAAAFHKLLGGGADVNGDGRVDVTDYHAWYAAHYHALTPQQRADLAYVGSVWGAVDSAVAEVAVAKAAASVRAEMVRRGVEGVLREAAGVVAAAARALAGATPAAAAELTRLLSAGAALAEDVSAGRVSAGAAGERLVRGGADLVARAKAWLDAKNKVSGAVHGSNGLPSYTGYSVGGGYIYNSTTANMTIANVTSSNSSSSGNYTGKGKAYVADMVFRKLQAQMMQNTTVNATVNATVRGRDANTASLAIRPHMIMPIQHSYANVTAMFTPPTPQSVPTIPAPSGGVPGAFGAQVADVLRGVNAARGLYVPQWNGTAQHANASTGFVMANVSVSEVLARVDGARGLFIPTHIVHNITRGGAANASGGDGGVSEADLSALVSSVNVHRGLFIPTAHPNGSVVHGGGGVANASDVSGSVSDLIARVNAARGLVVVHGAPQGVNDVSSAAAAAVVQSVNAARGLYIPVGAHVGLPGPLHALPRGVVDLSALRDAKSAGEAATRALEALISLYEHYVALVRAESAGVLPLDPTLLVRYSNGSVVGPVAAAQLGSAAARYAEYGSVTSVMMAYAAGDEAGARAAAERFVGFVLPSGVVSPAAISGVVIKTAGVHAVQSGGVERVMNATAEAIGDSDLDASFVVDTRGGQLSLDVRMCHPIPFGVGVVMCVDVPANPLIRALARPADVATLVSAAVDSVAGMDFRIVHGSLRHEGLVSMGEVARGTFLNADTLNVMVGQPVPASAMAAFTQLLDVVSGPYMRVSGATGELPACPLSGDGSQSVTSAAGLNSALGSLMGAFGMYAGSRSEGPAANSVGGNSGTEGLFGSGGVSVSDVPSAMNALFGLLGRNTAPQSAASMGVSNGGPVPREEFALVSFGRGEWGSAPSNFEQPGTRNTTNGVAGWDYVNVMPTIDVLDVAAPCSEHKDQLKLLTAIIIAVGVLAALLLGILLFTCILLWRSRAQLAHATRPTIASPVFRSPASIRASSSIGSVLPTGGVKVAPSVVESDTVEGGSTCAAKSPNEYI